MPVRPLVALAVLAVTATGAGAALYQTRTADHAHERMRAAAQHFLATLDTAQRAKAARRFDDSARFEWYFTPVARSGLPLREMTLDQRVAAHALLKSATTTKGYLKATGVMQLEAILAEIERNPTRRDPGNYHFWVFGTPSASAPWGWRFEGHHISLSFTSAQGVTVATPAFIGTNPAQVRTGQFAGWRLLANEEDLGRALVTSLTPAQRARAIISATAPSDIITGNRREATLERMEGLAVSEMTPDQRALLMLILAEYLDNVAPEIAAPRYARIRETGIERLRFAWAGTTDVGGPHYYRIHGPTVLIEYDNTQNGANHIHSVWRDLENDFGTDLLRQHYERADREHGHDHGHGDGDGRMHTHPPATDSTRR